MISVPPGMQPAHTSAFTANGIEAVTTTLLLPNACCLQVALLYRSPSVSFNAFLSALAAILNQMPLRTLFWATLMRTCYKIQTPRVHV